MQVLADVLNRPIKVHKSEQTCALGTAMFAATVAGVFPSVQDAMKVMGQGFETEYYPNQLNNSVYEKRYLQYLALGNFVN
jgi:L-ribulokinase